MLKSSLDEKESKDSNQIKGEKKARIQGSKEIPGRQENLASPSPQGQEKAWGMRIIPLFFIRLYQRFSALFPACCIYHPTCSEYAKTAFQKYSWLKAAKLTFFRILRCNPFSRGGLDPLN